MKIGIIVAMEKELQQLRTLLDDCQTERHHHKDFFIGQIENKQIILQQCGIGKVNAAIGAVEMINLYDPDVIISSGVAGGADVNLEIGDVVASTACAYHDVYCGDECLPGQMLGQPQLFPTDKRLTEKALHVDCGTAIHEGLIVSGDWFVDSQEKMKEILEKFPKAKAVDMESCAIAHTCRIYQKPFISFRIISDIPLKDHKAAQYFDFWNRLAEGSFNVTRHFLEQLH